MCVSVCVCVCVSECDMNKARICGALTSRAISFSVLHW